MRDFDRATLSFATPILRNICVAPVDSAEHGKPLRLKDMGHSFSLRLLTAGGKYFNVEFNKFYLLDGETIEVTAEQIQAIDTKVKRQGV
jgi:hypothetical protein